LLKVTLIWTNEVLQLANDILEKVNMKDTQPYQKYYIGLAEVITAAVENQEWEILPKHEKVMKALPGHLKSAVSKCEVLLISPAYLSQLEVRWKKLDSALKEVSQFSGQMSTTDSWHWMCRLQDGSNLFMLCTAGKCTQGLFSLEMHPSFLWTGCKK
jgi:hypothetical protein